MADPIQWSNPEPAASQNGFWRRRPGPALLAGLVLLVAGAGVGAGATRSFQREQTAFDPTLATTRIADLSTTWPGGWAGSQVAVEGRVAEFFGNDFVVQDASGRALVDTGRKGEDGSLVKAGEQIAVQGRFERGHLRASALRFADGHVETLGRPHPPHPPHRHIPGFR